MGKPRINQVLVDGKTSDFALASRILEGLNSHIPIDVSAKSDEGIHEPFNMEKKTLRLTQFQGEFLKPCPGTKEYICCGYQILNVGTNCPMDCSYCILQAYFTQPQLRVFVNLEEKLEAILERIDAHPQGVFRIGTGEFADSLALDPVTGWTNILLPRFSRRKNVVLELKTKTDNIQGLLLSGHRSRTVVSWSLNTPLIASREEHGAPSIKKRLQSARRCQEEGYVTGFHFDPLVHHSDWKEGYRETVEMMDKYLDPKKIIWISLGCLRFMPSLKIIVRRRRRPTHVFDGEFVPGLDGKMRYFKPIRLEMYAYLRELLESWDIDLGLYLCMESHEVWEKSMGWSPEDTNGLSNFLDQRVKLAFE